jgi:two-component system chemotaxis sensor kinase CheA
VEFTAAGGDNHLDAHVLAELRDALIHVVRNSVAHGIEFEAERVAAGKPAGGRIQLLVERRGNHISFTCKDDGKGINVEAVRQAAVRRGLVSQEQSLSLDPEAIISLMLKGGVTTTTQVTEVSGRGIGLDVVRETISRLKGEVSIKTSRGIGTVLQIVVPMSLASIPALVVDSQGVSISLPLDCLVCTVRISDSDISHSQNGDTVLYEGKAIPFMPLASLLGKESMNSRKFWTAVIVQSSGRFAAVGVDRSLGIKTVVIRTLPSWVGSDPVIAGAGLDVYGQPQLSIDPKGVVEVVQTRERRVVRTEVARPPVLVIDDSLTTRILEQSILESAGYEVDLAVSGEEALVKARSRKYGLFIVDIEMPGMDGFEFIQRARSDTLLREVPSILVTSRTSSEDRRRGQEAGAKAYIAKGEFDQGYLLQIIRELIG